MTDGHQTNGGFYVAALTGTERKRLSRARRVEGIDEEIAMLRTRIFTMVEERPDDVQWMLAPLTALARLVALRYRISPESKERLADNLAGVLTGIGSAMGLEEFDDDAA